MVLGFLVLVILVVLLGMNIMMLFGIGSVRGAGDFDSGVIGGVGVFGICGVESFASTQTLQILLIINTNTEELDSEELVL